MALTGSKALQKVYKSYSGFWWVKRNSIQAHGSQKPEEIIIHSIKGMLPKNVLGRQMLKKLKVYAGSDHPHTAQNRQLYHNGG